MALFTEIVLSFPTVVFSVALLLSCLYWLMVVLGAMDVEFLDAGDGLDHDSAAVRDTTPA